MTKKRFLRRDSIKFSRIGKNRKKLQKWRKAKGRDSQMRLKRRGYPKSPSIGYRLPQHSDKKIIVENIKELNNLSKNSSIIIAKKVGAKKKFEIIKKASEMHLKILNVKGAVK